MNRLIKSAVALMALAQLSVADIIVAPPPLAYSPLKEIGSQTSMQLNYLSFETDTSESTGYGIGISHRVRETEDTFHNFSFYYMYMNGTVAGSNVETDIYTYNAAYQYGVNLNPKFLGFIGGGLNYSNLESGVPIGSSGQDDIYVDTLMYSVNAGVQYEHNVSFGVLIPWVAMAYIVGGSSDTETVGLNPSSSSRDIDSFGAYQLGFDIYFDAIATSLSSMYQSSEDGDLLSLSMSYNF